MTDKDKLLRHFYEHSPDYAFKTSTVIKWGVDNYSNRAPRNARQLAEEGYFERITDPDKKANYGHFGREASYRLTEEGKEKAKKLGQLKLF
jgi:hypothetical protein